MKKTTILLTTLLLATGLYAQAKAIAYVDIETAKNQVATLTAENDTLSAENTKLSTENTSLNSKIASNQNTVNEINPIMENVKAKGSELYTIISTISDKKMKDLANASLTRNKELQSRLDAKKLELEKEIAVSLRTITNNQKQIEINNSKMLKNRDTVVILSAAVSKTEQQQAQLANYMKDVDSFLTNAEAILKK